MSISGLITALATPFLADGALDGAGWRRLLALQEAGGAQGVVVAGSTGEAATLSDAEYDTLLRTAVEVLGGRMPVLAGTGHSGTARTIEATRRAATLLDAVDDFEIEALRAESTLAEVVTDSRNDLAALPDVDAAAVNNNYAVQAGLDPARDPILKETNDGPWVNIIAVREQDKDKPWVKQFVQAYQSPPVKQFIAEKFKGAYVAAW